MGTRMAGGQSIAAANCDGNADARRALYAATRRGFLVTNYEQVVRDFDAIAAWNPDLVSWMRHSGSRTGPRAPP